jgi:hemolysin III
MTQNPLPNQRPYGRDELLADAIIHGGALTAALFGAGFVMAEAWQAGAVKVGGLLLYVLALVAMLGFSAAYNLTPPSRVKWILRRFDHSAIYLLIAGTYTPLLLQLRDTGLAGILAVIIWGGAALGITVKVLKPGRYDGLAVIIYMALGWVGVFAASEFISVLPPATVVLIAVGGLIYSAGVPFHLWERLKFQNAIWHGFVATAATCHFIGIAYLYV